MTILELKQLYATLRKYRKVTVVAAETGLHRNTIRNQLTGINPARAETIRAAKDALLQVQEQNEVLAAEMKEVGEVLSALN
jgi:hypothetical protein